MARTGMTDLINLLRDYTVAGTADYTLGTVSYWSDNQLQTALDRHKLLVKREPLEIVESYDSGTLVYKEYRSQFGNYEATTGGTAIFEIENAVGVTSGTANWTADYANGIITFAANTAGTPYYLTGTSYDVHAAAADIWRQKMGHHSSQAFKWSTDNMTVDRSGLMKNDSSMADYHASQARIKTISWERSDTT